MDSIIKQILVQPLPPVQKIILLHYAFYGAGAPTHSEVARFANVVLKTTVTHCHALEAKGYLVPTGIRRGLVKAFRVALP